MWKTSMVLMSCLFSSAAMATPYVGQHGAMVGNDTLTLTHGQAVYCSWTLSGPFPALNLSTNPSRFQFPQNPIRSATHCYTLWCISSHSFSAASMRVCQPGPDARKRATTSGESRMVTRSLTGAFCGPRVDSLACKEPGRELNEWALAKSSVVHSGLPFSDSR